MLNYQRKKYVIKFLLAALSLLIVLAGLYIILGDHRNIEKMTWEERKTLYGQKIIYELDKDGISYQNVKVLAESPLERTLDNKKYVYVVYSYDSIDDNKHYVNMINVAVKWGRPVLSSYRWCGSEVNSDNISFSCKYIGVSQGTTNYCILYDEFYDDNTACMQIYYTDGTMEEKSIQELGKGFIFITKYDFKKDAFLINRLIALDKDGNKIADCPMVDVITQ